MANNPQWTVEFYPDSRNRFPVREYIERLPEAEQAKVRNHIRLLREMGPNLPEPYAKHLKGYAPLCELRPVPHRVFYFQHRATRCILLHAFHKKKLKTDRKEIERAHRRMLDFQEREP